MQTGTLARLVASLVLALSVVGSGAVSTAIVASAGEHKLTYTDRADEGDPPEVALGIAMGAFRGLFVNYLWMRATDLKDKGLFYESIELAKLITRLQPRFPRVWIFHAWNLAYNVSVETQTPEERWQWVNAGISILRDKAIPVNPKQTILYKELGWFFLHKIGGFTDDANRYYKRRLAKEWHSVMGEPPRPESLDTPREEMIRLYAEKYIGPVVEAPATRSELARRAPKAAELLDEIERRTGLAPSFELLESWTTVTAARDSVRAEQIAGEYTPTDRVTDELLNDERYADAWDDAINFTRRRVLIDDYNMSPQRMLKLTEELGPIDWRVAGAHAIYWSSEGVREGLERATESTRALFDFINTDRVTVQGIQHMSRYGTIYFNYLSESRYGEEQRQPYIAFPNLNFAEAYGKIREGVYERGGVYQSLARPRTDYAAGYENFIREVIIRYYRMGYEEEAERWLTKFRSLDIQNQNDPRRQYEASLPVGDFVIYNTVERVDSPHLASNLVSSSLFGAYRSLLLGDGEAYATQIDYAADAHRYFLQEQFAETVVTSGTETRMEYLDRDFGFVAGIALANFMEQLPVDDAELLYTRITDQELRRYAYDRIVQRFKPVLDQAEQDGGPSFDIVFPQPPGMEQFRQKIQAKLRERYGGELENINRQ